MKILVTGTADFSGKNLLPLQPVDAFNGRKP